MIAPAITFAAVAELLAQRQYRPFPGLQSSKTPAMAGWNGLNKHPWDTEDLLLAVAEYQPAEAYCACIAVQPELVCIDIDIMDPPAAVLAGNLADLIFGPTPLIRIGQAPKQVRIYRNSGDIRSRKLHPVEIFSGSGQIVAFGWHHKAERPYLWINCSPLDIAADSADIPKIAQAQIDKFTHEIIGSCEYKNAFTSSHSQHSGRPAVTIGDRLQMLTTRHGSWRRAAAIVLSEANEGYRNDTAWTVIASGTARGISESDIVTLFDRHFTGWDGFSEAELLNAILRAQIRNHAVNLPLKFTADE